MSSNTVDCGRRFGNVMNSVNRLLFEMTFCVDAILHMPTMYLSWCENCSSKSELYVSRMPFSMPIDSYVMEKKKQIINFLLLWSTFCCVCAYFGHAILICQNASQYWYEINFVFAYIRILFSVTNIGYCPWHHSSRKSWINRCASTPLHWNQFGFHIFCVLFSLSHTVFSRCLFYVAFIVVNRYLCDSPWCKYSTNGMLQYAKGSVFFISHEH